ncbi:carboxypeptidase-like regulatory domain-containing protein [Dyadobacter sandarakinus]|uniref:Carboxypeptidase-like regulatory domain-containing protein n=2 Tax=Dyadobacter sandarakinus TaxID=2747268 RepID=A0ABX7IDR6_9BACT|nr:carboxypeptidase-like regulatory domain-containing protein [Dyadobacter sandarakinus]
MCQGQHLLNRIVTVKVKQEAVSSVLKMISTQGKFSFSYNSNLVPGDSLVSLNVSEKTVKQVLGQLFKTNYQYKEKGEYLIILPPAREKSNFINGYIYDEETNNPVDFASVYSRQLLISSLSGEDGHFQLKVRESAYPVSLSISKIGYGDTTLVLENARQEPVRISIRQHVVNLDTLIVRQSGSASTWLGRLLLSARLQAQGQNIRQFFVSLPYQASLTPGLSTQGRMSSQVINKFSLNLAGGYTGGTDGAEIAGGFNISNGNVQYAQIAGGFNLVSGDVKGAQIAGLLNHVTQSVIGAQVAGFANKTKGSVHGAQVSGFASTAAEKITGAQISGAYNQASDDLDGLQVSGAVNLAKEDVSGAQITGGVNIGKKTVKGTQIGVVNYAHRLKGVQIGVINVADSSSGASIGLLNFIKNSTSNVSVYTNEIVPVNVAWKLGTHHFYTVLQAGASWEEGSKAYTFGAGIGREFFPFKRLGMTAELGTQNIYLGNWDDISFLHRVQLAATLKLGKRLLLFAGPAFSFYQYDDDQKLKDGYKKYPAKGYRTYRIADEMTSWIGWQAGVSWRYGSGLR